jgi:3D (Asp-Asp-Asp) domain-containing protein
LSRRTRGLALVALLLAVPASAGFGIAGPAAGHERTDGSAALDRPSVGDAARSDLGTFLVTCYALRGRTADGGHASLDVVAVDPSVVPLGTRLVIDGVGVRVAADTGRKIRGRHLDVWAPTRDECVRFGAQRLRVWLG